MAKAIWHTIVLRKYIEKEKQQEVEQEDSKDARREETLIALVSKRNAFKTVRLL